MDTAQALEQAKNKGGRPRKEINQELLERCLVAQTPKRVAAFLLGIGESTLERHCHSIEEGGFEALLKKSSGMMNESLRLKQFEVALSGNVTMLIWLGKQYLGQTDRGIDTTY